jgi:DNA-binding CsgD family transcriptional regulator
MNTTTKNIKLSKRETEILKLVCNQQSSSKIAANLKISIGTVYTHRKNILKKTGVANSVGLMRYAIENGLVE